MMAFNELGRFEASSFGVSAISWQEITAYKNATSVYLSIGDMTAIRELSIEYVSALQKSKDPALPSPKQIVTEVPKDLDKRLVSAFRALAKKAK